MADDEVTLYEVYRGMQRIEADIAAMKSEAIHRAELEAIKADVQELQDANRWLTRTVAGALILAILAPILALFGTPLHP